MADDRRRYRGPRGHPRMTSGTQLPMKRMVFAGVVIAAVLAGCSDESATDASSSTTAEATQETSSVTITVQPSVVSPTPPAESEAAATPDAVVPEAPTGPAVPEAQIPTGSDMPHGEQLYFETCEQFISAIDALAATGAVTRQQSATGISDQLRSNPSWSTLPPEDQGDILRGLQAAGQGSC